MYSFPLALWKAFQKDLEASGLRLNDLADACNTPYHVVARWFRLIAPDDDLRPETPPPAHKFILAEKAMGQYGAWQVGCEYLGGFFTLHPHVDPKDDLSVFVRLEKLHETTVNLSERLRLAWADQKITRVELNGIVLAATKNQAADQEIVEWAREMLKLGEKE